MSQAAFLLSRHAVRAHATRLAAPSQRRTFLSAPEQKLHVTRTLPYTQKQLYDVVSDTDSYHRFLPFCTSSRVVSRPPPGAAPSVPTKVELSVGFMGVEQSYISDVFCTPNERVEAVASEDTPIFTKLKSTWTFTPVDQPSPSIPTSSPSHSSASHSSSSSPTPQTRFDLHLVFGFINPLHAALSAASMEKVSRKMAEAFETRCTQLYGAVQGHGRDRAT